MDSDVTTTVHGTCDPEFDRVARTFEANFRDRGEVGAAVCLYKDGRKIVDLWGGLAAPETQSPWHEDTIVCMMSVSKAMAGICVLRLVDRGAIALDAPVARYWPGFAQAGKAAITVEQLLGGFAGLIYAEHAPAGSMMDWDVIIDALERQAPVWPPGTRGAYHSATAGFLFGELVHKVDGRTFAAFFHDEVAVPLGIDFTFGLDDAQIARVAPIIRNPGSVTLLAMADPSSKLGKAWRITPVGDDPFNSEAFRRGVAPSGNGHGNARAVARLYAALAIGGTIDGVQVLTPATLARARQTQWDAICGMTDRHFRYGLSFMLNRPPFANFGPNLNVFGHPGAGGAVGLADPDTGMSFSYSPNFMCSGAGLGDRCEALIEAAWA